MTRYLAVGGAMLLLLAGEASAQNYRALYTRLTTTPPAPKVHRLEINNGTLKSVAYFGSNLSAEDLALLRELGDAESDPLPQPARPAAATSEDRPTPAPSDKVTPAAQTETPEMREHRYNMTVARVNASPLLCQALNLPQPPAYGKLPVLKESPLGDAPRKPALKEQPARGEEPEWFPLVLTLRKNNERVLAAKFQMSGTDITVLTVRGQTLKLKANEIGRIQNPNQ